MKSIKRASLKISTRIGIVFLLVGVIALVYAVWYGIQIIALTGLGLTFWGALFLLITPVRYVEGGLLESTAVSSYSTMDRIIRSLNYQGQGYYVPPYPNDVYTPEHLKGLKEMIVFVPAKDKRAKPSIEEMAKGSFLVKDPEGILLTPPGIGLLTKIERDFKVDFTKLDTREVCEALPHFILDKLNLAEEMEITPCDGQFDVKITDSIYKKLYNKQDSSGSVGIFGCPIVSAVACALAKSTGKFVTIQNLEVQTKGEITARFQVIQGENG